MKKLRLPIFLLLLIFSFGFLLSKFSPIFAQVTIKEACDDTGLTDERNPRPAACYTCNQNELLTPSCATSFEIFDEVEYTPINEGPIVKESWEGEITVNPKDIKIPFVGKRNMEPESTWEWLNPLDKVDENSKHLWEFWEKSNASEAVYLADYLEGTNEYYRNYGNQTTLTNYQGVLRKLTPFEYQNQAKKQLIERAKEEDIHDYQIKYIGRVCWDAPFWVDAIKFLTERFVVDLPDVTHYCVFEAVGDSGFLGWFVAKTFNFITDIGPVDSLVSWLSSLPGMLHISHSKGVGVDEPISLSKIAEHLPPDPNEEKYSKDFSKYEEDFLKWKYDENGNLSKWYRLWQATPMLSREDTLGEINPYLAKEHEEDSELALTSAEESKLESVPHLARLYEGSQIISNILTPTGGKGIEMVKTEPIPETTPPNACFKENYILTKEGDSLCCEPITATFKAVEEFENPLYEECQSASPLASCYEPNPKDVSRGFGVNIKHPYLDEIWSYTTNANGGFFNIFRPYEVPAFEDIDTAQVVSYSYNPGGLTLNGEVSPQKGLFFFPHLGGVQKAKEWVVNQALWPYEETK